MHKTNKHYFIEFEEKYQSLIIIDSKWYQDELGITSFCSSSNCKDKKGNFTEEWYRARFVYMMVKSGLYPKENICVEFSLPKGNGGKAIQPDVVVFKESSWNIDLSSGDYEELRKKILAVFEAKDNSKNVEKAIEKQIEVALERRLTTPGFEDWAYGVYFDNLDDIVILKKEGLSGLERFDVKKMIAASKNIVRLNVALRDNLESLPSFKDLVKKTEKIKRKYEFKYSDMSPIGVDSFQTILDHVQRVKDQLQVPRTKDLLVEALTLKVHDEKSIKDTNEFSRFYISEDEIRPNGNATQEFRSRINALIEDAKQYYSALRERGYFQYRNINGEFIPFNSDDEKMMIEMIKAFQGKGILEGTTSDFNQTIFNNFGDEVEKSVAGQFFTPIPVIGGIVPLINPKQKETIVDPCSGICDFLAMAWKHSGSQGEAFNYYGFDISPVVLKLAELNLVINGVGTANIHQKNSIFEKMCKNGSFTDIQSFKPENFYIDSWKHKDDQNLNVKQYKILITNPPFGKGRDLKTGKDGIWSYGLTKENLEMYETWSLLGEPKSIDMGIIFLENAYKILEPGGRLAIVLSNSIASIASWSKVRKWFLDKMRLVGIVDLPQNSFGETGVATTVLIAYKPKENEMHLLENDYEVFIREIKYTGYEVKTVQRNVIFEPIKEYDNITFQDTGKLREDFTEMLELFEEYMKSQEQEIKAAFGRI
ncbi:HsdM family class I SAM-dependent methyltransferase [Bacillus paranthracis]